jgi:hypothetical protein
VLTEKLADFFMQILRAPKPGGASVRRGNI